MAKKKKGNSEQVVEEVMDTIVEDSNADFFDALETQVNGAIQDAPAEQATRASFRSGNSTSGLQFQGSASEFQLGR